MSDVDSIKVQVDVLNMLKFRLRQKVRVTAIKTDGVVTAAMLDGDGWSYRVAYWDCAQRRSEWLFDFEIEEAK